MNATLLILQSSQPGVSQVPFPLAQYPIPSARPEISHRISAGFPSPAADYTEDGLDLNALLVQHKAASFFFTVEGDSMRDAGILDGDKVVVDRSVAPLHGHIVIAVIDAEYTLKRLYCQRGRVELRPDNPAYKSICLAEGSELQIWGVVTGVVRKLRV
ncbi:translesion error-prone DNA polymerase V autoproteolytic subunit [Janthinobacterium sp. SUN176]|uniref:LexA family protein n=1 Tax=Janthinobacterium sp. SUN176 TaxID=3014788 RepID=UPI00271298F1|nr:translesion error-prone DNA polymerase V autoproteolytic subunit [Janthinobacterium sp. SUN176]MDO8072964.1 translesion error-prone DNA polymerase V autoproteolytic subunit [Janthinobacterium sp. SUN176]